MLIVTLNMLLAAFAIGLLILVHELGHFLAAKAVRVRVEAFSIGFGKKVFGIRKGETEYMLSLIPLGGYVKLAGESSDKGTGTEGDFCTKSVSQRAFVFASGVAMNMALAMVGFIVAFAIGVPFDVAKVGDVEKGWPAWEAGLREGDRIVRVNDADVLEFHDVLREVALGGQDEVTVTVLRNGQRLSFNLEARYDDVLGFRRIGFTPPISTLVVGLYRLQEGTERCPAKEAGIELGDRIVSVNGVEVTTAGDIGKLLALYPHNKVPVVVKRKGQLRTFELLTEVSPDYKTGISAISSEVQSLQGDGIAKKLGFCAGDRIVQVNGKDVQAIIEVEDTIKSAFGPATFTVQRGQTRTEIKTEIANDEALEEFLFSFQCTDGNMMYWIEPNSPAAKAGLRPGDRLVAIAGKKVESWLDILRVNGNQGRKPREFRWERDGKEMTVMVTPVTDLRAPVGTMGCLFERAEQEVQRLNAVGSIGTGLSKTWTTIVDMLLTLKSFAKREVSTKNVGGVVMIAYSSYRAAQEGLGKLLYVTALLSAAIGFVNILPIPVLDGGHILFLAVEKVRGKPLSERTRAVSQYVGLVLLLALVAYALTNDFMRLFGAG